MRNIFLVYIPPGNAEAMLHYDETIRQKVAPSRIHRHVAPDQKRRFDSIFGERYIKRSVDRRAACDYARLTTHILRQS